MTNSTIRCRGLTLLEVLVTVSILAASSVGLMTFIHTASVASVRGRCGVDEIASQLRAARNTAISRGGMVEIRLAAPQNASSQEAPFLEAAGAASSGSPLVWPLVVPAGVQVQGWTGSITFGPRGDADRSLDLRIASEGRGYRLQLFRASGIISVEKS